MPRSSSTSGSSSLGSSTVHPRANISQSRPSTSATSSYSRIVPNIHAPGSPDLRQPTPTSRIPVTPAVLRSIFSSSRTPNEERSISRVAFFRFTGFLLSCVAISLAAARGRGYKSSAALLGVV
ncbi:hypothetical protein FIBSPDRAFT_806252 [Athelia psychrophila]|uniref:Uncharacterized protein n=1 Tax=Athelia psychrophila TaxID=1759441 RepID=A0A167VE98_9AGAM|nr:hypothetical protein FIBSPDRAFT_845219 [Fibularhizoctonia sp. CBS 109695]KZP04917.1 hypothetical protein FIBSPDRAFT_806252 [Fibularhizoctonia sp. CBS 109695]